jgi:glycolate oxidase FAD binding subunit
LMKVQLKQFADTIRSAGAAKRALCIQGTGSKLFYGGILQGDALNTSVLSGISAYEPTELVVTAKSGTSIAQLEATLAAQGQWLNFEPPYFSDSAESGSTENTRGTVGGMIATGLSGPRRAAQGLYAGAVRDAVLGIKIMDGRGDVLNFGGQVMKNVAGYDVARMMVGAMGTLGLILEVSIKVLPMPLTSATIALAMDEARAIERLNQWGGQPIPVTASAYYADQLHVRLEGAEAAVGSAIKKIGGERVTQSAATAFWQSVRDHQHGFFADAPALWRVSVPSIAPPMGLADTLIEWGGAQRWIRRPESTVDDADKVRQAALQAGGHATLFRGGDKSVGVFTPLDAVTARIHEKLKAQFDPYGVFNPGRFY